MINRRFVLALPLLLAMPARAQPADPLALALAACWQARGVRFTPQQLRARMGDRQGRAALQALAGAITDADGEGQEIAVEILWADGAPVAPLAHVMAQDLARGLPLLLLTTDGRALLLTGISGGRLQGPDMPAPGLAMAAAALIARPVIAGA